MNTYVLLGFYKTSSINVSLDIYHNRVKDKIVAVPQRNLFIWSVINYGQVNINGIDLQTMFKAYISHSIDLIIRGDLFFIKELWMLPIKNR